MTYYVYAGGTLIAEVNGSGQLLRSYTWGANGLVSDYSPTSGRRYYLFDGTGNTFALTDGTGVLLGVAGFGAWGKTLFSSLPSTPFGWTGQAGQFTDSETGNVYCYRRYYTPKLGRWLSRDPIGFAGGINLYGYCGGDPVNFIDPSGLDFLGISNGTWFGIGAGIVTVVACSNPATAILYGVGVAFVAGTGYSAIVDGKGAVESVYDGFNAGTAMVPIGDGIQGAKVAYNLWRFNRGMSLGGGVAKGMSGTPNPAQSASSPAQSVQRTEARSSVCQIAARKPNASTEVVDRSNGQNHPWGNAVRWEDAIDEWNTFLGTNSPSNIHPRTGAVDNSKLVAPHSFNQWRSIRYGGHEMGNNPHYHQEYWYYDPVYDLMYYVNVGRRLQ